MQKPTCLALVGQALPGGRLEPGLKLPFVRLGSRSNHSGFLTMCETCRAGPKSHQGVLTLYKLPLPPVWAPGMHQSPYRSPCGHGPLPGQSGLLSPGHP